MIKFWGLQRFAEDIGAAVEESEKQEREQESENKELESREDKKSLGRRYTDEDVDRIIAARFARWEKDHQKKVDEAKKLAEMNATEKAEYEAKKLRDELEELKAKNIIAEMSKEARKMFEEEKINISDDVLSMLVATDSEKTKVAVESFIKMFKDAVQLSVKETLKGSAPKKGSGDHTLTRGKIMKVENRQERQRLIQENMELFKK